MPCPPQVAPARPARRAWAPSCQLTTYGRAPPSSHRVPLAPPGAPRACTPCPARSAGDPPARHAARGLPPPRTPGVARRPPPHAPFPLPHALCWGEGSACMPVLGRGVRARAVHPPQAARRVPSPSPSPITHALSARTLLAPPPVCLCPLIICCLLPLFPRPASRARLFHATVCATAWVCTARRGVAGRLTGSTAAERIAAGTTATFPAAHCLTGTARRGLVNPARAGIGVDTTARLGVGGVTTDCLVDGGGATARLVAGGITTRPRAGGGKAPPGAPTAPPTRRGLILTATRESKNGATVGQ